MTWNNQTPIPVDTIVAELREHDSEMSTCAADAIETLATWCKRSRELLLYSDSELSAIAHHRSPNKANCETLSHECRLLYNELHARLPKLET